MDGAADVHDDTNTLDTNFSKNTAGRLVAVQHEAFTPYGYGGGSITTPSTMQFVEMYSYTTAGLTSGKRLQVNETLYTTVNGVPQYTPRTLNMDALYAYDTGGEGKVLSVTYPSTSAWSNSTDGLVSTAGPEYTYSFDSMYRPTGLTQGSNTVVNNVSYNAANQLMTFNTETRQYNNLNQMIRLTVTGQLDISYNFTAGQNNGKITSQTDNISMETVMYTYDSLNRLITASSAWITQPWSEAYGYDSFGNLLSKYPSGGAPTLQQTVYTTNNQIMGQNYDNNGNQTSSPLGTVVTYDFENRLASVAAAGVQYAYDSRNKRIWRGTLSNGVLSQQVYFYGVDGQKLGTYTFTLGQYGETNTPEMTNSVVLLATFFGRKRVGTFDRLGSAKYNANGLAQSFYPYGEDRGTMEPNDSLKFATYTRDTATGLDYADQRYYASNFGRFMSPDRYKASGKAKDPRSWNRYAYTRGDPANRFDPSGRWDCDPEDDDCDPCPPSEDVGDPGDPGDPCGGGGGGGGGGGDEYPRLNCQVGETIGAGYFENIPDPKTGTKVKTWVTPIWLSYTVTGGDGNYNFFESQYFVSFNLVSVQGGPFKLETFPWGPDGLLNYDVTVTPDSTTTTYGDAPGLGVETAPPNANFLGFSWTAFFTSVSVTSGDGQTVNCPTVEWQNFTTIARKNGKEYGFGTNSVIAVF